MEENRDYFEGMAEWDAEEAEERKQELQEKIEELEEKYKEKLDIDIILQSHRLRLAAKNVETKGFVKKAHAFCKKVVEEMK